ncbi:hypothetical protein BJ166DRAFT_23243 [Pestalotiopsis sp. NC0098]|nr:hypothetical protein BJ166DRAFT_23243 [Pestalotiopsis sp. NC0098]
MYSICMSARTCAVPSTAQFRSAHEENKEKNGASTIRPAGTTESLYEQYPGSIFFSSPQFATLQSHAASSFGKGPAYKAESPRATESPPRVGRATEHWSKCHRCSPNKTPTFYDILFQQIRYPLAPFLFFLLLFSAALQWLPIRFMAGLACLLHHAFIAQFCIHCLLTLSSVGNHATAEAAASGFRTFLQFLSKRFSSFLFLFSFFESWRNVALFKAMRRSGLFSSTYTPPDHVALRRDNHGKASQPLLRSCTQVA